MIASPPSLRHRGRRRLREREPTPPTKTPVSVKYSELSAIVYVSRPQVQMRLRGTLGAVLSHGGL
jgi:hypothetical protein